MRVCNGTKLGARISPPPPPVKARACSHLLPGVAMHPFYDKQSLGLLGYSRFEEMVSLQQCELMCSLRSECVGWTYRHGGGGRPGNTAGWCVA